MEHFSEQSWADFERAIGDSASTNSIAAHLQAGCPECKRTEAFWARIRNIAASEVAYAPPENLVRLVKLQVAAGHESKAQNWTFASLVFDSLSQPLAAGIRSSAASPRQVVYEADGLTVDLRFDHASRTNLISVVGQVLDKQIPRDSLHGASIVLWTEEGHLVASTEANEFGEFQLEFERQQDLQLAARAGRRTVRIPLANL